MKTYKTYILLISFILLSILVGCTGGEAQLRRLEHIDSLMETKPQVAYDSLCQNQKEMMQDGIRKVEMRHRLLMAKTENKLFKPMPSISAFQDVVDYYDHKGTANDKMEAHYLMGCIYRDRKEAPMAIQCYQEAVECADTLSKDCDYTTLFCIYGQMSDVYRYQYLQKEALACDKKYSHYASLAKNTFCAIQGLNNMANKYYALGDTMQAIKLIQKCREQYIRHGMHKEAAQVLPTLFYIYLYRAQYKQAHHYMNIYEKESGLFDKNNNIQSGREHYYKAKGLYYWGINQIDSAEYYYRKLGRYNFDYEAAQGLQAVYIKRQNNDSIKKYSAHCEQEMDKILNGTQAKVLILATSLYNYNRLQKDLNEEKLQKERGKYIGMLICGAILLVLLYFVKLYKQSKKQAAIELNKASLDYTRTYQKLKKAHKEMKMLQENTDHLIKLKQKEIVSIQATLQEYKNKYEKFKMADKKKAILTSSIVQKFNEMAKSKKLSMIPQEEDWEELYAIFQQYLPVFYDKLRSSKLSTQELHICILTFLNKDNTDMAILVNTSTKNISNVKQKANKKLFNDNRASSLYNQLLNI